MEKHNYKVLIVEDDSIAREVLEIILGKYFVEVKSAVNGQEGLDTFKMFKPDLVITDLAMPVLDGFHLIDSLAKNSPDTKIIVTTAYREEAKKCGNCEILYKPIDRTKLLQAIGNVLGFEF